MRFLKGNIALMRTTNLENIAKNVKKFQQLYIRTNSTLISPCVDLQTEQSHTDVLQKRFNIDSFKSLQWLAINATLNERRDTYINLPTGYGKSLCYQYPAVYSNKLSVVVSPLISLMQDQVRLLEKNNIPSCFLSSIQENKGEIIKNVISGYYNVLYVTPEYLMTHGYNLMKILYAKNAIILFAIDEVHCLLNWGTDFRPFYNKLSVLRTKFPSVPIMALTATSTYTEMDAIINHLSMKDPEIVCAELNRPNLHFMVKKMTDEPLNDLMNVINDDTLNHNVAKGSMIIYCLTKQKCRKICKLLKAMEINCKAYHGDLNRDSRKKILNDFMDNKIKIVVATNAFSLGINKPDIRIIIHYGASLNMEAYYQEAGRAGRDGKPALCVLFYSPSNFHTHTYLNSLSSKSMDSFNANQYKNSTVKQYVTLETCRRQFIMSYFRSEDNLSDYKSTNNCCDNCFIKNDETKVECSAEVELILKSILSLHPKTYGIKTIVSMIKGKKINKFESMQLNPLFGAGVKRSENWWKSLVFFMENEGYIKTTSKISNKILYPKIELDKRGKAVLSDLSKGIVNPVYCKI